MTWRQLWLLRAVWLAFVIFEWTVWLPSLDLSTYRIPLHVSIPLFIIMISPVALWAHIVEVKPTRNVQRLEEILERSRYYR